MNARKSGERTKVWWTHESLSNARKSGHERTKVWTWTHESLVNARKSGHKRTKVWWTHESLVNARKSVERTKVWTWTHESLDMNARKSGERTKVWTWTHDSLVNARRSGHERTKVWWTHESLDISTFRLGRSGHRHFPSGTVWTYRLSVWDLNLGVLAVTIHALRTRENTKGYEEVKPWFFPDEMKILVEGSIQF